MSKKQLKYIIKNLGLSVGFNEIGIAMPDVSVIAPCFLDWLKQGYCGSMDYLNNHCGKRLDPKKLMPNVKSIICCSLNYLALDHETPTHIAKYALGRDYHQVMHHKLKNFAAKITAKIGTFHYRVFCDSAPVLEKYLAQKAGLGWIGKNTLLINPQLGSYCFLGFIFTDLDLASDTPIKPRCGKCNRCLNACPTRALTAPYKLDARRCLAYLTIEHKDDFSEKIPSKTVFGCDICQQICPWNRFGKTTTETDFMPLSHWLNSTIDELKQWDEATFNKNTAGTALSRLDYKQWKRNLSKI